MSSRPCDVRRLSRCSCCVSYPMVLKSCVISFLSPTVMNYLKFTALILLGASLAILVPLLGTFPYIKQLQNNTNSTEPRIPRPNALSHIPDSASLSVVDEDLVFINTLKRSFAQEKSKAGSSCSSSGESVEALANVHAAMEMNRLGKTEKAIKLFRHALALCPSHPDVLIPYGEFLETTEKDLLEADHLYTKALIFSPNDDRALLNRQRTTPLVEELDEALLDRIDGKRDELLKVPDSSSAFRRIKKEAYFQHIYHTLGIEGNTMSLAQTRMVVETRMAVGGKSLVEHNEILGLDAALKYINSTLVSRIGAITFADILEIHRRVLGFVNPFESGQLRSTQVYVGSHIPPGPSQLQLLVSEFITWLNSAESLELHPIRYAALAHYKLVYIHPFSDGNGRTSRLLMNLILMQAGYPPVIIRKQDRQEYYESLQLANQGDVRPFIRFIARCAEQTVDVYLWATSDHGLPVPALAKEDDGKTILVRTSQEKTSCYPAPGA